MGLHRVGPDCSDLACMHSLEKEMATHYSILAWRIPGMEEPGGLPSVESHRVGHNWSDLAAAAVSKEDLLGQQRSKQSIYKGNQPWVLIGMTDAEAKAPILWPPFANIRLIEKDPDAGKDWRHKEKRAIEDEVVGWHHQWNLHELGQALRDGEGQGGLAWGSPWNHEELDMAWQLKEQ